MSLAVSKIFQLKRVSYHRKGASLLCRLFQIHPQWHIWHIWNRQGGTLSPSLQLVSHRIFVRAESSLLSLSVVHLKSTCNLRLSEDSVAIGSGESRRVGSLFWGPLCGVGQGGGAVIDLFATRERKNARVNRLCSQSIGLSMGSWRSSVCLGVLSSLCLSTFEVASSGSAKVQRGAFGSYSHCSFLAKETMVLSPPVADGSAALESTNSGRSYFSGSPLASTGA